MPRQHGGLNSKIGVSSKERGFTLLEMLLSVAVIALLAGLSVPVYQLFQVNNALDVATVTSAQTLRRAQVLSQAVYNDTTWGVYIDQERVVLFAGGSYASRDTDFDEVFDVPGRISVSGTQEFVYEKLTGELQSPGTLTLSGGSGQDREIAVNKWGKIAY